MSAPPKIRLFPLKSRSVRSSASNALLRDIVHSVLQIQRQFNAECVVRPPSKRVAAIPDDAIASAILFCDRMVAKISERRKVLPVPPGASMKNSPPLCSVIARIILSYAMRCSRINCGRFVLTNVPSSSEL
ncbi:transposon Tf2-6 polyprotein [Trichonephila clavipes]|uniref:Transposon Tf2-6 polyprotein n=1 Tax=Trichonephila clavipes TaxID=2585209 RepID=A0A8X6WA49_TRICX|nr:transposon Tf2-6 polyprotein [Trichonephila clavipes]